MPLAERRRHRPRRAERARVARRNIARTVVELIERRQIVNVQCRERRIVGHCWIAEDRERELMVWADVGVELERVIERAITTLRIAQQSLQPRTGRAAHDLAPNRRVERTEEEGLVLQ